MQVILILLMLAVTSYRMPPGAEAFAFRAAETGFDLFMVAMFGPAAA